MAVFGSPGSGDGDFANAAATAVNLSTGDVYVVDQANNRVERFDGSGGYLGAFGWGVADGSAAAQTCSSGCQAGTAGPGDGQFDGPQGIAIDQSDGSVYVVDGNNSRVEKFDASGNFLAQFASGGSAEGQLSGPQGVAVDPTDRSVYVADAANNRIEKFDHAGAFVSTFGFGVSDGNSSFETCTSSCQTGLAVGDDGGFSGPTRVAVDSTGRIYVLDSGNGRVERFTDPGTFDEVFDPTDVNAGTFPLEIAIGPGNDHLYVAQAAPDFSEQRVFEIDQSGALVDMHGVGDQVFNASGLALNAGSQKIYFANGFNAQVLILGDIAPPTLAIDPVASITPTGASVSGSVTPNGDPNVGWHFEISTDDANRTPTAADQNAGDGNTPVSASQNLTGLVPNTHYFVRLAGTRLLNPTTYSPEVQFDSPAIAPDVTTDPADDVTPNHATLTGRINPNNSPTTYYFEYGPTTTYGTSLPATRDADAGSADAIEAEIQSIYGLQSHTTYHYRLVATNATGTTRGADQTFTTTTPPPDSTPRAGIPGAGFLPDNRGWEKVSPEDKNGGDIMADNQRARVAADGNGVTFASLTGFGDAIGTGTATDYLSTRTPGRWATHAIMPPQRPTTYQDLLEGLAPKYVGPFSADLSRAVFLAASPLTANPFVANVANLYRRDDVTAGGTGSYQLVSACPACESTDSPLAPLPSRLINGAAAPFLAGTSADFAHVLFESQQPLTSDLPGNCSDFTDTSQCPGKLYEWDHGTVRLAGILPDDACGSPPCVPAEGSQAGQGAGSFQAIPYLTPHTISADGSRIFFTVPTFPGSASGTIYMRVDHSTTVQINASERTPPDPGGPQPATYWDASVDGTRVFFSTTEALTDDAPADGARKLYMYDATRPASDPHNITLISPDREPADTADFITLQGVSASGDYVYFAAAGQLVAGGPFLDTGRALYVWHGGTVRYIASLDSSDLVENTNTTNWTFNRPTARVTPDGTHLLFSTTAAGPGPTGYDQGHCGGTSLGAGCREFYVYSYSSGRVQCASCNPSGDPAAGNAFAGVRLHTSGAATASAQNQPISDDGRRVFFSTADALLPADTNGAVDVYEYDVPTATLHLITSGSARSDSYFMNASPSGNDVFFLTAESLVGSDKDDNYDMYDARVDGGFPASQRIPSCAGDSCQPPESEVPHTVPPGTSLVGGSPPSKVIARRAHRVRCKKGYARRKMHGKVKCIKKRNRSKPRHRRTHGRAK